MDDQALSTARPGLSGTALKLMALVAMAIDHIGFYLMNNAYWMRAIGRLAFPIFAFLVVEGFYHTRDRKRYALRLGVFALISELCFDLPMFGLQAQKYFQSQNIFFTLLLGLLGLWAIERLGSVGALLALGCLLAGELLRVDYRAAGVLVILLLGVWREKKWGRLGALAFLSATVTLPDFLMVREYQAWNLLPLALSEWWCLLDIPLLARYNGQRGGEHLPRWATKAFYAFYPAHLLLIGLLMLALGIPSPM